MYICLLLESPIVGLSLNTELLSISIPQDQERNSGSKKKESDIMSKLLCIAAFYRTST